MQLNTAGKIVVLMLAAVFVGCLPSEPEGTASNEQLFGDASPDELVAQFTSLAQDPAANAEEYQRYLIAEQLAQMGPRALTPLLDIIASPESSGVTKLFALRSMHGLLGVSYIPELQPLLESEDVVVRACAVTLLAHIDDPQVLVELQKYSDDPAWNVSFASLSGMAMHGDAESRAKFTKLYFRPISGEGAEEDSDPGRLQAVRREVLRVILLAPMSTDMIILRHAVADTSTDMTTRVLIVSLLNQVGDEKAIEPLRQSLATNEDPEYVQLVNQAIDVISEREQAVTAGR